MVSRFFVPITAVLSSLTVLFLAASPPTLAQDFASNLVIESTGRATTVTVVEAWAGAPDLTYALVPRGTPVPAPPPGATQYAAVITTPVRRVVSLATTNIPHLRDLGALSTLVAVDTGDYVYDSQVLERIASGQIRQVSSGGAIDLERVIALQPDVVLITAFGPDDSVMSRLRQAGIPTMVIADWREADPLGRAEWLRLFGALLDRNDQAQQLLQDRAQRYLTLRDRIAREVAAAGGRRPTVMANGPWQGQWPVPAGESYMARLFADAGGRYLWEDTTGSGSLFLDMEVVLARAAQADFWINLNFDWFTLEDVRRADGRLTAFAPFRNGSMYHHIRRVRPSGANDFWESGLSRPDVILQDLAWILHGPGVAGTSQPTYYSRIR